MNTDDRYTEAQWTGPISSSFFSKENTCLIFYHLVKELEHLRNLIHVRIKNPPANAGDSGDMGSISGSRRYPGGESENLPPAFLPGQSH